MGSIQEEWLIYFHPATTKKYFKWTKWWCRKPNFGHCGALQYIPEKKIWIDLQGTHNGIQVLILTPEEATDKLKYLHPYEILICPVKEDWHFTNLNLLSCVTLMMKLIGFYRWWIITPYQLYCALLNAGYKPFWNKSNKGNNNGKKKTDS